MKYIFTILLALALSISANAQEIGLYKSVNLLQPNRANELFVSLPDGVDWKKVELKTESGEITKSEQKGKFTLTPKRNVQRKVEHFVEIYEGKKLLQKVSFAVPFSLVRVTPTKGRIYSDCKNSIKVEVLEGHTTNKNISIEFENATLVKFNKEYGYANIIPNSEYDEIRIKIFADSDLIATETLKVAHEPKPEIELYFGNYPVDLKEGIYLNYPKEESLNLKFTTNSFFDESMAAETDYQLEEGTITLARGNRAITEMKLKNSSIDLPKLLGRAEAGDRLVLEIGKVSRTNSAGMKKNVEGMGNKIYTIPLK
ncbi:MAG: hypothetical protein ACJAWV_004455 [Flammeovirgaceae bacterium]|jgi:hypothetical protein